LPVSRRARQHNKTRHILKHPVVGDEFETEPHSRRGDPSVGLVHLLTERPTRPFTPDAQLGAHLRQLIIGLDNDDASEIALKSALAKFTQPALTAPYRNSVTVANEVNTGRPPISERKAAAKSGCGRR
jgi:hypothetical protein